jgi:hypothetical protein
MLRMNRAGSSPLAPAPVRLSTVMDFSALSRNSKFKIQNANQDAIPATMASVLVCILHFAF